MLGCKLLSLMVNNRKAETFGDPKTGTVKVNSGRDRVS